MCPGCVERSREVKAACGQGDQRKARRASWGNARGLELGAGRVETGGEKPGVGVHGEHWDITVFSPWTK